MRRSGFILLFLLAVISTGYSQTYRMEVQNEPLSKVLNMLDLELSYDARALSEFSVSISSVFENQEKALLWLLEDKPFRIEKLGNVFVIVPRGSRQDDDSPVSSLETEKKRFVYKGTVVSQTTGESLEYAVISLLDADGRLLINGITSGMGQFTIQTSHIPAKIKINYLGYETLLQDIRYLKNDLGVFSLTERVVQLGETVVTSVNLKPVISRKTFIITSQMQDGVDNALELLNKIPGVYFDASSVFLNHQTNILLMVDGIQHSPTYLKHLSPRWIQAVEVIHSLSGQLVSDDYAGVINFILKKDYTGYNISLSNNTSLNLSKSAGNNRLAKNHPSAGFVFSTRKLNFFGAYDNDLENRKVCASKSLLYSNKELTSIPTGQPNDVYDYVNHTVSGGLDYHITPHQHLGILTDFTSGNTHTFHEYTMRRTDFSNNYDRSLLNTTENRVEAHTFTGTLFYQGHVTNRLRLNGDFSYNYYYNDLENDYIQDEVSNYHYLDLWNEYKNQTVINLNGKYILSDRMSVETGYSHIFRQYASTSSHGSGFLDYSEYRNKIYAYLSCYLSDKTGLKLGLAPEFIRLRNGEMEKTTLRLLPYLHINHPISRTATLSMGYATNQSYPSLYQLSPIRIVVDTILTQMGNPALISAVKHRAYAELSLWNKLIITPQFNYGEF